MKEHFAKTAVAAIIERTIENQPYILMQERQKENDLNTNGLIEIAAGKVREYENVFDALKREVYEETGLTITNIIDQEQSEYAGNQTASVMGFTPFYITQNLDGIYSLIVMTFICEAEGQIAENTNETINIRWVTLEEAEGILLKSPEKIFPLHLLSIKKYIQYKTKS
ncbi:NUDIX hydrolase [Beduini massiliensis]|uniref:NUDIX hydrolase n=1 Tax=Beduini massiliensis TaxID=1585974 RepID=UPI00059A845F|nr:NUDIX domain-containing protein [Beduini massiliensis]